MPQVQRVVRQQLRAAFSELPEGPLPRMLLPVQAAGSSPAAPTQVASDASVGVTAPASACCTCMEQAGCYWDPWAEPGTPSLLQG